MPETQDTDAVLRGLLKAREDELHEAYGMRYDANQEVGAQTKKITILRREVARLRIALGLPARETQPKAEPGEAGGAGGAG